MNQTEKEELIKKAKKRVKELIEGKFDKGDTTEERMAKMLISIADKRTEDGKEDPEILFKTLEDVIFTGILEIIVEYLCAEEQITQIKIRQIKYKERERKGSSVIPEAIINLISAVVRSERKKQKL